MEEIIQQFIKEYLVFDWNGSDIDIQKFTDRWNGLVRTLLDLRIKEIKYMSSSTKTREFMHGVYEIVYNRACA